MMGETPEVDQIFLMMRVVCPLLILFGTFGNIMTILVLRRIKGRSAMSTYFTALAITDLVLLYFGVTLYEWIQFEFDIFIDCLHTIACKTGIAVHYMSSALSSWYLVIMTMQRAMSVVWPLHTSVVCTRKVSLLVSYILAFIILVLYSHVLFGYSLSGLHCQNSSCTDQCQCGPGSPDYRYFMEQIWPWIDLPIASVGPFVLLLVSDIVLVRSVLTSAKNARQRFAVGQSFHVTARERKATSMSVTLIVLSITFLILTCPLRVYFIAHPYVTFKHPKQINPTFSLFVPFLMFAANSVVNFYLYCLTGTKFREEVVRLFLILFGKM